MYTVTFVIPGLPKPTNAFSYLHWTSKKEHNDRWYNEVYRAVYFKRPPVPLKKAQVILERHSSSEPDFDGLVGSFKSILDGLTQSKIIENDKTSNIGQPQYRWFETKRGKGFIKVTVTEVLTLP